jgi:hypothetical protein
VDEQQAGQGAEAPATITIPRVAAVEAEIKKTLKQLKDLRAMLTLSKRASGIKPTPKKKTTATA